MIIKKMTVIECWCPKCGEGQMKHIMDDTFRRKGNLGSLIGEERECPECNTKNVIDDIVELMPTVFEIYSRKDIDNYKVNEDVKNHLEDDNVQ